VVGAAIARELARYRLDCVLLEAGPDVGAGTSKANTAIWHTGFDAKPGTLEARLVRRGHQLLGEHAPALGIPLERVGALLVAWNAEELAALPGIRERAEANGCHDLRPVALQELYEREPHLGPGATGALEIPGEGIVCPWTAPLAFATEAVAGGVELRLATRVEGVRPPDQTADAHELATTAGPVRTRWLVNAAGLRADELDRMLGHHGFTVTPRRGQLVVLDKLARPLLHHILLPVPTATTKGVLAAPTVFGNVLLGPTAEDTGDKADTATTADGLAGLLATGARILPGLLAEEVTAVYAGLRAATEHADYQIRVHGGQRYACVGGVRSTGLTASLAIAEHVVGELGRAGLPLHPKTRVERVRMPNAPARSRRCSPRPAGAAWPRCWARHRGCRAARPGPAAPCRERRRRRRAGGRRRAGRAGRRGRAAPARGRAGAGGRPGGPRRRRAQAHRPHRVRPARPAPLHRRAALRRRLGRPRRGRRRRAPHRHHRDRLGGCSPPPARRAGAAGA
jgi:glycerol-3-phosphate dehydrogenase